MTSAETFAQTTAIFKVLIDSDNSVASGCVIATPAAAPGFDQVLTTTVAISGSSMSVVKVESQQCVGGSLLAPVTIDGTGWAVETRPDGRSIVETHMPLSLFGTSLPPTMRVAFVASVGSSSTSVLTQPDGSSILFPQIDPWRRRVVLPVGPARTIVLDGSDSDWTGVEPLVGSGGLNGAAAVTLNKVFAFAGSQDLFFYFQAFLNTSLPIAVDDAYTVRQGQSLVVPAPGVLANDIDPAGGR